MIRGECLEILANAAIVEGFLTREQMVPNAFHRTTMFHLAVDVCAVARVTQRGRAIFDDVLSVVDGALCCCDRWNTHKTWPALSSSL